MMTDFRAKRMLIIEDDPTRGRGLESFFVLRGFAVTRVPAGEQAARLIQSVPPYDVVLLDVQHPPHRGLGVLREARNAGADAPVVLAGADPGLLRRFGLHTDESVATAGDEDELIDRVRDALKQKQPTLQTYRFGDIEVDLTGHRVFRQGQALRLTAMEFELLRYFILHRGRTLTRKQLLRDVWKINPDIATRTIDRHIASIRKKIEPNPVRPTYIETVYGIGYKFTA